MLKSLLGNNARILHEQPWLWAVNPGWSEYSKITFTQINQPRDLQHFLKEGGGTHSQRLKIRAYAHFVYDIPIEEVKEIEIEPGSYLAIYRVLDFLNEKKEEIEFLNHLVFTYGDEGPDDRKTLIYRAKRGLSLKGLYDQYRQLVKR